MPRHSPLRADPISTVSDPAFLQPLVRQFLQTPEAVVDSVSIVPLGGGTSGAALSAVTVALGGLGKSLELVLKQSATAPYTEVQFYRSLASQVPVETPRTLWTSLPEGADDGVAWVLMEKIPSDVDTTWTEETYQAVIRDLAVLHGRYWGRCAELEMSWLRRPDEAAISAITTELVSAVEAVGASWLREALSDVLTDGRLDAVEQVVPSTPALTRESLGLGTTLVHGDMWWCNVLLLPNGRRVFVDWGGCRVFAGVWELAYFIDLSRAVRPGTYRDLPIAEKRMVGWYQEALREQGIEPGHEQFMRAYRAARLLQPLVHWFGQLGQIAVAEPFDIDPATHRHLAGMFARLEQHAQEEGLL